MSTPEERAREIIDGLLIKCGWVIQDYKQLDLSAAQGIAIREVRLKEGRCDYLLLVDRNPVGIIEAKKAGVTLCTVADQSGRYVENLPDFLRGNLTGKLPFLYESTGIETYFRDDTTRTRVHAASSRSTAPKLSRSGSKSPTPFVTASPKCRSRIPTTARTSASAASKRSPAWSHGASGRSDRHGQAAKAEESESETSE
ncbi:MAG: type I restriction endonuclease [Chthoniobacterales bacterium]